MLVWSVGLGIALILVLGLAYLVGRKNPSNPTGTVDSVLAAASSPGLAVVIVFAGLTLGAWCVRRVVLHSLAWRPGRIEVGRFTAATPVPDADLEQMTMEFRRYLATLRLQSPMAVPGAAPEGDFLDVLGRSTVDSRNILGTLLSLLRAGAPNHAYEVQGALRERSERPRYGVTIQIVQLPSESTLPITVWGRSWEDALIEAANEATAAILPRTRHCRAPWAAWRRSVMPRGLLHAYEEATRLEQERRYDEALDAYYAASYLDPMNMVLRLRIGQLQERLGLFLDALMTYWGIDAASRPAGKRLPILLYRGRSRSERRRAQRSARYRRIVLLGGRSLAEQWLTTQDRQNPTLRDKQRDRLRECLSPLLQKQLEKVSDRPSAKEALDTTGLGRYAVVEQDPRFLKLRDLFAKYALKESRRLRVQLWLRPFDRRTTLSAATVGLTALCIKVRRAWIAHQRQEPKPRWPPAAEHLRWRIRRIELLNSVRGTFKFWHEHYNAACAYALPLQDTTTPMSREDRAAYAESAVCRLKRATARADSAYLASRRDWLLSEDPDLKGLRRTDEFRRFEVIYLPSAKATPRRPRDVQALESSRYVKALLVTAAQRWQEVWHRRASALTSPADIHELLSWFTDELRMWQHVRDVARDFRHLRTRLALIKDVAECADKYGFEPLAVAFPRYEDEPLDDDDDDACDAAARAEMDNREARLAALSEALCAHGPNEPAITLLDDLTRWQATLQYFDATSKAPSQYLLAQLCDHHAAMWQLLEQWLTVANGADPSARRRFRDKAKDTRRLWYTAQTGWDHLREAWRARSDLEDTSRLPLPRALQLQMIGTWSLVRVSAGERRHRRQNGRGPIRAEERSAP